MLEWYLELRLYPHMNVAENIGFGIEASRAQVV